MNEVAVCVLLLGCIWIAFLAAHVAPVAVATAAGSLEAFGGGAGAGTYAGAGANVSTGPFRDQVVLVTGATGGIGGVLAAAAVQHGARRVLVHGRTPESVRKAMIKLMDVPRRPGTDAIAAPCDFSEASILHEWMKDLKPTVVIHAAHALPETDAAWQVNVATPVLLAAAWPGARHVVFSSGAVVTGPRPAPAAYVQQKRALEAAFASTPNVLCIRIARTVNTRLAQQYYLLGCRPEEIAGPLVEAIAARREGLVVVAEGAGPHPVAALTGTLQSIAADAETGTPNATATTSVVRYLQTHPAALAQYPTIDAPVAVRRHLATLHGLRADEAEDTIMVFPGTLAALETVLHTFVAPGSAVAVSAQDTWPPFQALVEKRGRRLTKDAAAAAATYRVVRTQADVDAALRVVAPLLILDEAYAPRDLRVPQTEKRIIRVRSLSKREGLAALRVAYVIADAAVIRALRDQWVHPTVGPLQEAAIMALTASISPPK